MRWQGEAEPGRKFYFHRISEPRAQQEELVDPTICAGKDEEQTGMQQRLAASASHNYRDSFQATCYWWKYWLTVLLRCLEFWVLCCP